MKNNNKISSNDDYSLLRVISFIFPIIGLIIYAVNVGKHEYLAKESSKWAIRGMILFFKPIKPPNISFMLMPYTPVFRSSNTKIFINRNKRMTFTATVIDNPSPQT